MLIQSKDKPCCECSLNGGDVFECMAGQEWIRRGNEHMLRILHCKCGETVATVKE